MLNTKTLLRHHLKSVMQPILPATFPTSNFLISRRLLFVHAPAVSTTSFYQLNYTEVHAFVIFYFCLCL